MKSTFSLGSAIEKSLYIMAFIPLISLVYPASIAKAYSLQSQTQKSDLVFEIELKEKEQLDLGKPVLLQMAEIAAQEEIKQEILSNRLQTYLEKHNSPLAIYSKEIVKQPQWQRALAISFGESNYCKRQLDNNCSGIGGSKMKRYPTLLDWFKDMSALMEKPLYKEKYTTCDTMNGVYNRNPMTRNGKSANWGKACNQKSNELIALTSEAEQEHLALIASFIQPTLNTATANIELKK